MEPRFGRDFSGVRVHSDAAAQRSARDINAKAYAVGHNIVFGAGEFAPRTHGGRRLLAHELTHVLQQQAGCHTGSRISEAGDAFEQHADAVADRAAAGDSAAGLLDHFAPVSRMSAAQLTYPGAWQIQRTPAPVKWTKNEIQEIQRELIRLGLYRLTADGDLGSGTDIGLVEAFGGDEWRVLSAAVVLMRLKKAKSLSGGKTGEHEFRYGEMFKDGLLDMTLGLGFDEKGNQTAALDNFVKEMKNLAFKEDRGLASSLYKKAGRTLDASAFGRFFVLKDALTYTPPAGPTRKISAVVRLIYSLDASQGKEVATAFKEGMVGSDVAYYSGHGRYGSGPDFDRASEFTLLAKDGKAEQKIKDYDVLETIMENEGKAAGHSAWDQFLWRVNNNRILVIGSTEGNVVLSKEKKHQGEFGGKLMYWIINRPAGKGAPSVAGKGGELANKAMAETERKYRVVVFDGCRSVDYEKSIRVTPGFDVKSADMLGSERTLEWGDEGPTLAKFLDSIIKMQSAEEIVKNMDAEQHVGTGAQRHVKLGAYRAYGVEENPIIK